MTFDEAIDDALWYAEQHPNRQVCFLSPSFEHRRVLEEKVASKASSPVSRPGIHRIDLFNGSQCKFFVKHESYKLRGQQFHRAYHFKGDEALDYLKYFLYAWVMIRNWWRWSDGGLC